MEPPTSAPKLPRKISVFKAGRFIGLDSGGLEFEIRKLSFPESLLVLTQKNFSSTLRCCHPQRPSSPNHPVTLLLHHLRVRPAPAPHPLISSRARPPTACSLSPDTLVRIRYRGPSVSLFTLPQDIRPPPVHPRGHVPVVIRRWACEAPAARTRTGLESEPLAVRSLIAAPILRIQCTV